MSRPPIVLLHGFAARPEVWRPVTENLPAGSRWFAPQILGHHLAGGSPANPTAVPAACRAKSPSPSPNAQQADDGFEAEVDRLAEKLRRRGLAGSHLVGYSLGGRLALGLLVRHRPLFSMATLLGTHPGLDSEAERRERRQSDEAWAQRLERQGLEAFLDAWEAQPLFATQSREQRAAQRVMRQGLSAAGLALAMRRLGLGRMPCYRGALGRLALPVCWAAGERDLKFRHLAEACAAAHGGGSFRTLSGAGHNVVLERPRAVAELLSRSEAPFNVLEGSHP